MNLQLTQGYKLQAVLRDTFTHPPHRMHSVPSASLPPQDGVDPAFQAARGFLPRLFLRVTHLDLRDACAAVEGNGRNRKARVLVVLLGHLVMVKDRDLHVAGFRFPGRTPQVTVNLFRRLFTVSDGADDEAWAEGDVTCREDPGERWS